MTLVLLDPNSGDPISRLVAAGDPVLPVLENAKTDRGYHLVVSDSAGQTLYRFMPDAENQQSKVDDIEGVYLYQPGGENPPPGPITLPNKGVATLTVQGTRGKIKHGVAQEVRVLDTVAVDVV